MLTLLQLLACTEPAKPATPDTGDLDTGDTSVDTSDSVADTSDTGNVDTADTGAVDSGTDTATDTGDTGAVDSGTDTGSDTGTDTASDTADTGSDTGTTDLCAAVAGSNWSSVDELECGRTPYGVALCHWRLSFSARDWNWHGSDYAEAGTWTCTAGNITSDGWDGTRVRGVLSDATHLAWDGTDYVRD